MSDINYEKWHALPEVVSHTAMHSRVLVALVRSSWNKEFTAFVFPVPGQRHEAEVGLWQQEGEMLSYETAKSLMGGTVEMLENMGGTYSRRGF